MLTTKKAAFLDIDGTLMLMGKGPFDDDVDALTEANARGHKIFINTGRGFGNIQPSLLDLPFWTGVVAAGGAHVLFRDEGGAYYTVYHHTIDRDLLQKVCALYLRSGKPLILEGEERCYVINVAGRMFTQKPAPVITSVSDLPEKYGDPPISKVTMQTAPEAEERAFLEEHFTIHAFPFYAELFIKGENKSKGMGRAIEKLGIKQQDCIALGDSLNDLDMIRWAGTGIAMGNAQNELKAAADVITGNCGQGGVAEAVRKFLL